MNIKKIITILQCKRFGIKYCVGLWIHPTTKLLGRNIHMSEGVQLHSGCLIDCDRNGQIHLGKNVNVNSYSRIESMNSVIFENNVLIGPNVYISDRNHEYKDISVPVKQQGYYSKGGILIGEGSWLGIHSVIIGSVHIGKHCVVGANCVVTNDIPDFSVVVGNPARIVKQYNSTTGNWGKL